MSGQADTYTSRTPSVSCRDETTDAQATIRPQSPRPSFSRKADVPAHQQPPSNDFPPRPCVIVALIASAPPWLRKRVDPDATGGGAWHKRPCVCHVSRYRLQIASFSLRRARTRHAICPIAISADCLVCVCPIDRRLLASVLLVF